MEAIKGWVLNIVAVAVLMIVLDLLMPEGKIRKFTQLLTGFIIMFVMLNPVLDIFGRGIPASFAGWSEETFLWNNQVRQISGNLKEDQSKQTLVLYRQMLLSDIRSRLENHEQIQKAEVDIVLNENLKTGKFGEIRKLYVNLLLQKPGEAGKDNQETEASLTREIQKELQQVFLLEENEIIIYISEGN